jgi:NADH:ubiquinone oxidoreductase subunit K
MVTDQTVLMITGTLLLLLGIASVSFSKHLIKSMMAFQVAVFGANLALFASGITQNTITSSGLSVRPSDMFVMLSVLVGAAVEAIGLAVIVTVHRKYGTLNPDDIRRLRSN